ncbi:hypothetical protein PQR34_25895 [Paraburkholderia sediminicola]|uniref:hypothetical protein n=1 Tax=Paraburkholderia sediminicola TaxID=458836 RepID=UPI0038B7B5E5
MTTVAIWYQDAHPSESIWACSDSCISDPPTHGQSEPLPLLRHSPKIFPLQITCIEHGPVPEVAAFQHTIGLAYAGSSLFAVNLYAALTPILTNLRGSHGASVSIRNVAELAKVFLLEFGQTYGERYGELARVEIALFGYCKVDRARRVFVLKPVYVQDASGNAKPDVSLEEVDFSTPEYVCLLGDHKAEIRKRIAATRQRLPGGSSLRQYAPRNVIREVIKEKCYPGISGTVQLAHAHTGGLRQFMDLEAVDGNIQNAMPINFKYLGFDLDEVGTVGQCWFSLPALR